MEPDREQSIVYYQLAADQGDVEAMRFLADCYEAGSVVEQDSRKASQLREKADELEKGGA